MVAEVVEDDDDSWLLRRAIELGVSSRSSAQIRAHAYPANTIAFCLLSPGRRVIAECQSSNQKSSDLLRCLCRQEYLQDALNRRIIRSAPGTPIATLNSISGSTSVPDCWQLPGTTHRRALAIRACWEAGRFDAFCFDFVLGRLVLCEEFRGDIWLVHPNAAQLQMEWQEGSLTRRDVCFSVADRKRRMA